MLFPIALRLTLLRLSSALSLSLTPTLDIEVESEGNDGWPSLPGSVVTLFVMKTKHCRSDTDKNGV